MFRVFTIIFSFVLLVSQANTRQEEQLQASVIRGKDIYQNNCQACHMATGEGIPGAFPPLAKSDYLMADTERSIKVITEGLSGEITVNDVTYFGEMVPVDLTDQQVADVLNYIRNSWGNEATMVKAEEVGKSRE